MSQYMSFYLKSKHGEYLPIGTFSGSQTLYRYAQDYMPSYGVIKPFTENHIHAVIADINEDINNYNDLIERHEKELAVVSNMNNDFNEKLDVIGEILTQIADLKNEIKDMNYWSTYFKMLIEIIEEAKNTRFYDNKDRVIDANDYIYAGIECELPNEDNVD